MTARKFNLLQVNFWKIIGYLGSIFIVVIVGVIDKTFASESNPESQTKYSDVSNYYGKHETGWFWYQEKKNQDTTNNEDFNDNLDSLNLDITKKIKNNNSSTVKNIYIENEEVKIVDLKNIKAAELKEFIPKALDIAIDKPNINNVRNYYLLQKLALDKSENFEKMTQNIILIDSSFDELPKNSISTETSILKNELTSKEEIYKLKELTKQVGIFFFYNGTCPYCKIAVNDINELARIGFQVYAFSLDGIILSTLTVNKNEVANNKSLNLGAINSVPQISVFISQDVPNTKLRTKKIILANGLLRRNELFRRLKSLYELANVSE